MPVGNCPQGGVSVNHTPLTRGRRHYTSSEDARTTAAHRKGAPATQDCRRARTCKAEKLLLREASHRLLLLGYTAQRNRRAPNHSGSLQSCRARRDHQKAGIQLFSSVELHEGIALCIESLTAHFIVNGRAEFAPALYRSLQTEALDRFHRAVHRYPRHHFRMGEMAARAAHLPY